MSSGQRESVFPTRMTLNVTKGRLKGAQTGHSLLKRKADALTKRFRTITSKIDEAKRKMGKVMQLASFSLAEVQYVAGEIGYSVQESVKSATYRVQAKQENVSGVLLPAFEAQPSQGGAAGECASGAWTWSMAHYLRHGALTSTSPTTRVLPDRSVERRSASAKSKRDIYQGAQHARRAG